MNINTVYEFEPYPNCVQRLGCEVIEKIGKQGQYAIITVEQLEDLLRLADENMQVKRVASYMDLKAPNDDEDIPDSAWEELEQKIHELLD